MARSPASRDSPADDGTSTRGALTVAEVTHALKSMVEGTIGQVWIKGEVGGLKRYQSGHWYFTLRDADAQIRCVMWRSYAAKAREIPSDGAEVYVRARPTLWEERGELRLSVVALLPTATLGAQESARERVRLALEGDGLFALDRKRSLPNVPGRIAVVTSIDGAVLHDILTVRHERWPHTEVIVVPTRVQGEGAPEEVVRALGVVEQLGVEVCILARGGGAREDLSVFDDERVCRVVARMAMPVVSAVGHETDIALVDLVADRRAATPSAAAELVLPDQRSIAGQVDQLAIRLAQGLVRPTRLLGERILRSTDRMVHAWKHTHQRRRDRLDRLGAQLDALSPLAVMQRGYSVAQSPEGKVLSRRGDFSPGMAFAVRLHDGTVPARVEEGS